MSPTLIKAIIFITLALVLYTIGVWTERIGKTLKPFHLIFFCGGLLCDSMGTFLMSKLTSSSESAVLSLHGITGAIAIVLMMVHAIWATIVLLRKNENSLHTFHKFSIFVWIVWLIPYIIGMMMGMGRPDSITSESSAEEYSVAIVPESAIEVSSNLNPEPDADIVDTPSEQSPFAIWEYDGYVDECEGYTWQDEFKDCDYDDDGKNDRLSRKWIGDKELAIYTIEFGNGNILVTPEGWETGFPHIQSGDLDGDGIKEILVTLTYDTSTDPYSFGDMWLFDFDESAGEYDEVELPLVKGENGAKGINVDYDKPEDNKIRFTLREAGLSSTVEVDQDYLSNWWADNLTTQLRPVFYAEIKNDSNPVLRCYLNPVHRWTPTMGFNLNYVNGKYEIGYVEIDEPDYGV